MSRPGMKKLAAEFKEKATKANLPYTTIDAQACGMVSEWQILEAGVNGAGSLEDEKIAAWLKKNPVTTVYGVLKFDGPFNHGDGRPAHQAGAEQGVEGRLAEGIRRARSEADRVLESSSPVIRGRVAEGEGHSRDARNSHIMMFSGISVWGFPPPVSSPV